MKVITENEFKSILESNKTDLKIFIDKSIEDYKFKLSYLESLTEYKVDYKINESFIEKNSLLYNIENFIHEKYLLIKDIEKQYFIDLDNNYNLMSSKIFLELYSSYFQERIEFETLQERFLLNIHPLDI